MYFTTLSAVLIGLTSFAAASPIAAKSLAVREVTPMERGIVWQPRSIEARDGRNDRDRNNRRRRDIIIAQNINIQLTQVQIIQQVQLINVVQNLIVIDGGDRFRDNIRRNHYRNQNRRNNRGVNTVVIIVTQVVEVRGNQRRNRFVTRQVESNPEQASKEFVVVTEQSTLTAAATETAPVAVPVATGDLSAAAQPQNWDESAELGVSAQSLLLPEGAAAPRWEGRAQQAVDPALILEEADSGAFVGFV